MAKKATPKKPRKAASRKAPAGTGRARKAAPRKAPAKVKPQVKSSRKQTPAVKAPSTPRPVKKQKIRPISRSDLQYFRSLLLEKRREIIGDVGSMESEAFKGGANLSNMPIHMADVGTDNFEQEFTLGLIESERQTLREIQEALVRIDNGTYGICLGTGKPIPRTRLEAMPEAKYSIEYKRLLDQGKGGTDIGLSADDDGGEDDED